MPWQPRAEVAAALRVKQGSPIFRIERTSYSTGNRPVDYERLHYRGDIVQFVTRLAAKDFAMSYSALSGMSCSAFEKRLSLPPDIPVDRQRPRTTDYERRKASKIEQVKLVARRPELGVTSESHSSA